MGPGGKVDAPKLSSGPEWKMQGVSRVGAQGVTSKSKLLAEAEVVVQEEEAAQAGRIWAVKEWF